MDYSNADNQDVMRPLSGKEPDSFVVRLQNLFFPKGPTRSTAAGVSAPMPGFGDQRSRLWTLRRTREGVLADAKKMQDTDPRWASILDAIARDATLDGYDLYFHSGGKLRRSRGIPRAHNLLNEFGKQAEIPEKLEGWTRALVRDGDIFVELIVDKEDGLPIGAKKLDARITVPAKNAKGGWLHGPEMAYYQTDGMSDTPQT